MVYLAICRFLAEHPPAIIVPVVLYALAIHRMDQLVDTSEIPDLQFGFTPKEVHELMQKKWGEGGCQNYVDAAALDLFPYMESYAAILGAFLIMGARRQNWDERVALLGIVTMIMDVGETVILRTACQVEVPLSDVWIVIASVFNQLKWVLCVVCVLTILAAFIQPKKEKTAKTI